MTALNFNYKTFIKLAVFITLALLFSSCGHKIDFSKKYYKYKSDSTAVYASPDGPVLGYFKRQRPLDAIVIKPSDADNNGWVKIPYPEVSKERTYVNLNDFEVMTVNECYRINKSILLSKSWWANTERYVKFPTVGIWSLWMLLGASILTILCYFFSPYGWINWGVLLALNICEYVYFMTYNGDRTWFFDMDKSFILATISFIILATTLCIQIKMMDILLTLFREKDGVSKSVFIVLPIAFIAALLSWVGGEVLGYMPFSAFIEKAFLVIMGIIALSYGWCCKNKIYAICSVITFVLSYTAILLTLTYCFWAIIYVFVIYNFIKSVPDMLSGGSGSSSYSGSSTDVGEDTIYVIGYGNLTGINHGSYFQGNNGDEAYYVNGNWYLRKYGEFQHETEERIENKDPWETDYY